MLACKNSGYGLLEDFAEDSKTIDMPKNASKQIIDSKITRYAFYLTVQNGDPRKEVIAPDQPIFLFKPFCIDSRPGLRHIIRTKIIGTV